MVEFVHADAAPDDALERAGAAADRERRARRGSIEVGEIALDLGAGGAIAAAPGGSVENIRLVSRCEPRSIDRAHCGPSWPEPTTTWAEPPPTSTTATGRRAGSAVTDSAPMNARCASSTAVRIRVGRPDASASVSRSSAPLSACRPGLAISTSSAVTPTARRPRRTAAPRPRSPRASRRGCGRAPRCRRRAGASPVR